MAKSEYSQTWQFDNFYIIVLDVNIKTVFNTHVILIIYQIFKISCTGKTLIFAKTSGNFIFQWSESKWRGKYYFVVLKSEFVRSKTIQKPAAAGPWLITSKAIINTFIWLNVLPLCQLGHWTPVTPSSQHLVFQPKNFIPAHKTFKLETDMKLSRGQ